MQPNTHALILVFDYNFQIDTIESPCKLLSMDIDLEHAYKLATDRFKIKRSNITVVTDVKPKTGFKRPWDPLTLTGNPRIVQLQYPEIAYIIREIAQFIENTVRDIDDIISKGIEKRNEVFIYVSCHGARIPSIPGEGYDLEPQENALIFMTKRPNGYERRYLRSGDIFKLFFGSNVVDDRGFMTVSITRRISLEDIESYLFNDDEVCKFQITPTKVIVPSSKRDNYTFLSDRGLPLSTNMLVLFDTCHSQSMSDFHYVYNPKLEVMERTDNPVLSYEYPYCVSLAASENTSSAPSTTSGSPFTKVIFDIFTTEDKPLKIKDFHKKIYETMPKILHVCKPTICSTISDCNRIMPFMLHLIQ
jgi:hypothetical protein